VFEFGQHQSTNVAKPTMRTSTTLIATGGIIGVIAICVLVNQPRRPDAQISTSARAAVGPFSAPVQLGLHLTPLASSADDVKFTFEPSAPNGLLTFPIFRQGTGSAAQSSIQPRWVFHCKAPSIRRTSDPREAIDMMRTLPTPLVDFRYVPSADVLNAK